MREAARISRILLPRLTMHPGLGLIILRQPSRKCRGVLSLVPSSYGRRHGRLLDSNVTAANRFGALCGVIGVPLAAAAMILVDPASPLEASPSHPAQVVAQALADNADDARLSAQCGLVSVLLMAFFFARLHGVLRSAAGPGSWLPAVVLLGGSAFLAAQIVQVGFAFAAAETDAFAENPQVAMTFIAFGWWFPAVYAPCVAAVLASVTIVAFTNTAFPTWFAWVTGGFLAAMVVISVLEATGMASVVGFLGLLIVAVVVTFQREESAATPSVGVNLPR